MAEKHMYSIAFALGAGIGFFILTGQNTYGAGVWGQTFIGPFYSAGVSTGNAI